MGKFRVSSFEIDELLSRSVRLGLLPSQALSHQMLRGFVAASCCDCAVFSVAEAFVGAVGGLGVGAPEVAVSSGVLSRWEAGVDEQAF